MITTITDYIQLVQFDCKFNDIGGNYVYIRDVPTIPQYKCVVEFGISQEELEEKAEIIIEGLKKLGENNE